MSDRPITWQQLSGFRLVKMTELQNWEEMGFKWAETTSVLQALDFDITTISSV